MLDDKDDDDDFSGDMRSAEAESDHDTTTRDDYLLGLIRDRDQHLLELVRVAASLNASVKTQAAEMARVDRAVEDSVKQQLSTNSSIETRLAAIDKKLVRLHLWVVVLTIGMSEVVQSKVAKYLPSVFG